MKSKPKSIKGWMLRFKYAPEIWTIEPKRYKHLSKWCEQFPVEITIKRRK